MGVGPIGPFALANDYGPFTREDLIAYELPDITSDTAQPFADALARSMVFADDMRTQFREQSPRTALVLYDGRGDEELAREARLSSILISNLLGHFRLEVDIRDINAYQSGDTDNYDAMFLVGESFDTVLPPSLMQDALTTDSIVVWMQYGLEQIEEAVPGALAARGIAFERTEDLPLDLSAGRPAFFDTVFYRGLPFRKVFLAEWNGYPAQVDAEMIQIRVDAPAQTRVEIGHSGTGEIRPYIAQSGNFWFIGDVPMSYSGPRDRYVVFADILHDILGIDHPVQHLAMVRLEDLHAKIDLEGYRRLTRMLQSRTIPYALAVIPEYRELRADGGVLVIPTDSREARAYRQVLLASVQDGADVVMHGVTHQYGDRPNPDSGRSGEDYEYWDTIVDEAVAEDSVSWVRARIERGQAIMNRSGLPTNLYEMPHYLGSPISYRAAATLFPYTYQRVSYHVPDDQDTLAEGQSSIYEMQFFPYMIYRDHFGQVVVPENIGNLQYTPPIQTPDFLLRNAAYGLTVRDGVASLFVHSFLFVPYSNQAAHSDFSRVLDGISAMGYEWVGVNEYLELQGLDPNASQSEVGTN